MILPGESISKYQNKAVFVPPVEAAPVAENIAPEPSVEEPKIEAQQQPSSESTAIAQTFPDDEPIFATPAATATVEPTPAPEAAPAESAYASTERMEILPLAAKLHEEPVAPVEAKTEAVEEEQEEEPGAAPELAHESEFRALLFAPPTGDVEEEEIEDEEADVDSYEEDMSLDSHYDELEEEISHAIVAADLCLLVIRPEGKPGRIRVRAESDGLD